MKLILLFGNAAVGKMTVGQELAKITDLRLFHNHMTIELIIEVFGHFDFKTIDRVREVIFEEFARTDNYGMIFTFMWAFSEPDDWEYAERISAIFEKEGADIYYVELVASQKERLIRNSSANRLKYKPSKRDLTLSKKRLLSDDEKYRLLSNEGEITFDHYLRINNENLSPEEAACLIKQQFSL